MKDNRKMFFSFSAAKIFKYVIYLTRYVCFNFNELIKSLVKISKFIYMKTSVFISIRCASVSI